MITEITLMDDEKFNKLNTLLEYNGKSTDNNAFACMLENDKNFIILKKSFVDNCDKDMLECVIAHEQAHLTSIIDEEEADRWALKHLHNEKAEQLLISMWEMRHGHEFVDDKY